MGRRGLWAVRLRIVRDIEHTSPNKNGVHMRVEMCDVPSGVVSIISHRKCFSSLAIHNHTSHQNCIE